MSKFKMVFNADVGNKRSAKFLQLVRLFAYMVRSHRDVVEEDTFNIILGMMSAECDGRHEHELLGVVSLIDDTSLDLIVASTAMEDVMTVLDSDAGRKAWKKNNELALKEGDESPMEMLRDIAKQVAARLLDSDNLSPERRTMLENALNGDYDNMDVREMPLKVIQDHLATCPECSKDSETCDERAKLLKQEKVLLDEKEPVLEEESKESDSETTDKE